MSLFFNMVFYFTKEHPSDVFNRALERPTNFTSILPSTRNILFYIFLFYSFTSADKYYTFDIQNCSAVRQSNARQACFKLV